MIRLQSLVLMVMVASRSTAHAEVQPMPRALVTDPHRLEESGRNKRNIGAGLIGAGLLLFTVGAVLLATVDYPECLFSRCDHPHDLTGQEKAGFSLALLSIPTLIAGIPVLVVGVVQQQRARRMMMPRVELSPTLSGHTTTGATLKLGFEF